MAWPDEYGRRVLTELDSTNAEAARIESDLHGPEWILALHQTAARGRRGRVWSFPAGNFAATLVLFPHDPPDQIALRSFAAALALYDAVAELTGTASGLALKWPNDVLLNGGKMAGILLERLPRGGLAIGIGVNLIAAPDMGQVEARALRPVSVLAEVGIRVQPERMLDALASAYDFWEHSLTEQGFAPLRAVWLDRATRLGETITARLPGREVTGVFETVDLEGHLVLKTAKGREVIAAADVFFE